MPLSGTPFRNLPRIPSSENPFTPGTPDDHHIDVDDIIFPMFFMNEEFADNRAEADLGIGVNLMR